MVVHHIVVVASLLVFAGKTWVENMYIIFVSLYNFFSVNKQESNTSTHYLSTTQYHYNKL